MTAKEYLKQAYRLDHRINSDIAEMERLREMASNVSSPGFEEHYNPSQQRSPRSHHGASRRTARAGCGQTAESIWFGVGVGESRFVEHQQSASGDGRLCAEPCTGKETRPVPRRLFPGHYRRRGASLPVRELS